LVTISALPEERWREYRDLRLESLQDEPAAFGSSYEEEQALPEEEWRRRIRTVLFALEEGSPVGMITYAVSERVKTRHIAHIYGVYVRRTARGKGAGRELLRAALERIREHGGVVKVQLSVNPDMSAAVSLYEREGFVAQMRAQKELLVDGRYHDLLYMEKVF
jgi:ribosomal protein S18 acetylase RimI-like enzyme